MAQTAAHLVDHVIPPVPVRQWVISVPKRLRGILADRPQAVLAVTKIFVDEIERLLCASAGLPRDADAPRAVRPRLGAVSFLHRFGSALNHHVHLHACVTDGAFMPAADGAGCAAAPAFLPVRPIRKILTHLGEPLRSPPVSPARGPPTDWSELVQAHDDRDVFQALPDELPAIDIHSLEAVPDARRKRSRQAAGLGETPRRRWRNATPGGKASVPGIAFGARETQARGSRAAHQLGNGGGSAIGRAILYPSSAHRP